jgi:hypothetical protein
MGGPLVWSTIHVHGFDGRLDLFIIRAYIALAMNRFLLALLALLTGLTVQAVPAQARMCTGSETELNACESARGSVRGAASQSAQAPTARTERRDRDTTRSKPVTRGKVYIPSVQFGPDRALE